MQFLTVWFCKVKDKIIPSRESVRKIKNRIIAINHPNKVADRRTVGKSAILPTGLQRWYRMKSIRLQSLSTPKEYKRYSQKPPCDHQSRKKPADMTRT